MTEEKPPKRRMSSFGPEEPSIRSLKTELEFMQKRQVATAREHCIIHNRYTKNMEKAEKENRALKKARFEIGEKLQRTEDARSILALEVEHRNEELKRLSGVEKRAVHAFREGVELSSDPPVVVSDGRLTLALGLLLSCSIS